MAVRGIVLYPDPILRRPTRVVESFDEALVRLADDLAETMYAAPGVGLAAPQVGVDLRVT
ncbi:MAG TPA: peptide deformylase, partial [Thermoanaerobaculia bacterium]|nr:peptide deformylase [Thermoanaerobaculia bacterium]